MSKSKRIAVLEACVSKLITERSIIDKDVTKTFGEVGKVIRGLADFLGIRIKKEKVIVETLDGDEIVERAVFSKIPETPCVTVCTNIKPKTKKKKVSKK